ncbi:MAG: thermonuclease family protein [Thermodesulfobacteriota bacterium]
MKKRTQILFVFIFLFLFSPLFAGEKALVTGVIDGDTIVISSGRHVRYLSIDTPEKGKDGAPDEFLAREAYEYNRRLVLKKEVRLEYGPEKEDKFERRLAYVLLENGLCVNAELLRKGLAYVLYQGPQMERFEEFLAIQREAIKEKRGIWVQALEESCPDYRGHRFTRKFHRPDCPLGQKIARKNLIRLAAKKEAFEAGYSPCRTCKP